VSIDQRRSRHVYKQVVSGDAGEDAWQRGGYWEDQGETPEPMGGWRGKALRALLLRKARSIDPIALAGWVARRGKSGHLKVHVPKGVVHLS